MTGCGGETTDISAAVDDTNKNLDGAATMACDDEIDGGEGTKFDCTLKGTEGGKTETVQIKIYQGRHRPGRREGLRQLLAPEGGRLTSTAPAPACPAPEAGDDWWKRPQRRR